MTTDIASCFPACPKKLADNETWEFKSATPQRNTPTHIHYGRFPHGYGSVVTARLGSLKMVDHSGDGFWGHAIEVDDKEVWCYSAYGSFAGCGSSTRGSAHAALRAASEAAEREGIPLDRLAQIFPAIGDAVAKAHSSAEEGPLDEVK